MKINERLLKSLNHLESLNQLRTLKLKTGLVDFYSNDYLGLSQNYDLLQLIEFNSRQLSYGSGGSRLLAGNSSKALELEKYLAQVHNQASALLFNSGYNANLAFFSSVPSKDSIIFYDEKIHASIKDGMRLSFAKKIAFKHNDIDHLRTRLFQNQGSECFVVVESVYSMDGNEANLIGVSELCYEFNANMVVDEAHCTGNYGAKGSGLVSALGLDEKVYAKIHTFGKAIGAHGAVIVGSEALTRYLINFARPFIYTTALPTHDLEVIHQTYKYLDVNHKILQKTLNDKIKLFKDFIKNDVIKSYSPIQVVIIPGNDQVKKASLILENEGFDIRPVLSPTVKKGGERLRICLHNFNSDIEIKSICKIINSL